MVVERPTSRRTAGVKIRRATANDEPALVAAAISLALETERRRLAPEVVLAGIRGVLEEPVRGFYLVAERDGRLAASLLVTREWSDWRNGTFWWIQSVYVQPGHRGQGVFRAVYEALRRVAIAKAGVCGLRLYVDTENGTAMRTYEALGMTPARYRFYEDPFSD